MERPPPITVEVEEDDRAPSAGESRFDALIDERLSDGARAEFSRRLAEHDRTRGGPSAPTIPPGTAIAASAPIGTPFDPDLIRGNLRFRGEIPDKTRAILNEWVPGLVAFAEQVGLSLRGSEVRIIFYHRDAYGREVRPLPPKQKLPASSFQYNPLYRHYTVRVVLPPNPAAGEPMFNVLRTLMTRLYGDIQLREGAFRLEAYREDVEATEAEATVGLAEQVALLGEIPQTCPALEGALQAYARVIGLNYKRQPGPVRKAFCKDLREDVARQRISPERQAAVEETFAAYLDGVRSDADGEIAQLVEAVDALNRQTTFLPPEERPDQDRLKTHNPLHYLRSVKLRLEFLLEAFVGLEEDFEALEQVGGLLSPTAEDRVGALLSELEQRGLARPYLVQGVRLSEDLERKRTGFPLEVHRLLARFPKTDNPEKQFKSLSRKLENALPQRIYQALLLLRHWIRLHETNRGETFPGSDSYKTLKGLVANFRFRGPLLEALFIRIGIVLDIAEYASFENGSDATGGETSGAVASDHRRAHFPTRVFARVWGPYIAQALLAGYLAHHRPGRFSAEPFWRPVEQRIATGVAAHRPEARLTHVLHRLRQSDQGEEGMKRLAELLRQCPPAFRFAVTRALLPPENAGDRASRPELLDRWADAVLESHARGLRNAIVAGES